MAKESKGSLLIGLGVGTAVGAAAVTLFRRSHQEKKPLTHEQRFGNEKKAASEAAGGPAEAERVVSTPILTLEPTEESTPSPTTTPESTQVDTSESSGRSVTPEDISKREDAGGPDKSSSKKDGKRNKDAKVDKECKRLAKAGSIAGLLLMGGGLVGGGVALGAEVSGDGDRETVVVTREVNDAQLGTIINLYDNAIERFEHAVDRIEQIEDGFDDVVSRLDEINKKLDENLPATNGQTNQNPSGLPDTGTNPYITEPDTSGTLNIPDLQGRTFHIEVPAGSTVNGAVIDAYEKETGVNLRKDVDPTGRTDWLETDRLAKINGYSGAEELNLVPAGFSEDWVVDERANEERNGSSLTAASSVAQAPEESPGGADLPGSNEAPAVETQPVQISDVQPDQESVVSAIRPVQAGGTSTIEASSETQECIPTDLKGNFDWAGDSERHLVNDPATAHLQNIATNPDCPDTVWAHVYASNFEPHSEGWLESQRHVATYGFEVPEGAQDERISIDIPETEECWRQVDIARVPDAPIPPYISGDDMIDWGINQSPHCAPPPPEPTPTPIECIPTDLKGMFDFEGDPDKHMLTNPATGEVENVSEDPACQKVAYVDIYGTKQKDLEGPGWLENQEFISQTLVEVPDDDEDNKQEFSELIPDLDFCWYQVDLVRTPEIRIPPYYNTSDNSIIDHGFFQDEDYDKDCVEQPPTPQPTEKPSPTPEIGEAVSLPPTGGAPMLANGVKIPQEAIIGAGVVASGLGLSAIAYAAWVTREEKRRRRLAPALVSNSLESKDDDEEENELFQDELGIN